MESKNKINVTTKNVIHELLVDPAKVLLFPAHKTESYEAICESS